MVLRLERQREGRLVFLALSGVRFRLRIGQDPGGNVSILQSFQRGVLGQKCIQIHFCQLHPLGEGAITALACVGLKPCLKLSVRDQFLCLQANRASVPCVTDGKFGPGLSKGRTAVGFVGAAS